MHFFILCCGVSGSGKTAVGTALSQRLAALQPPVHAVFLDADDYHGAGNIAKMSAGVPLTDEDRVPWLQAIHADVVRLEEGVDEAQPGRARAIVLACSALKQLYRELLMRSHPAVVTKVIVYLRASREVLHARLTSRRGHFMGAALLDSQLAAFEEPQPCEADRLIVIDLADALDVAVDLVATQLGLGVEPGGAPEP